MSLRLLRKIDEASPALARILTPSEHLLLVALAFRANRSNHAWPSVATIEERTGMARRTIQEGLRVLEDWTLIEPVGDKTGGRPGSTTVYVVSERTLGRLAAAHATIRAMGIHVEGRTSCARASERGAGDAREGRTKCAGRAQKTTETGAGDAHESVKKSQSRNR